MADMEKEVEDALNESFGRDKDGMEEVKIETNEEERPGVSSVAFSGSEELGREAKLRCPDGSRRQLGIS